LKALEMLEFLMHTSTIDENVSTDGTTFFLVGPRAPGVRGKRATGCFCLPEAATNEMRRRNLSASARSWKATVTVLGCIGSSEMALMIVLSSLSVPTVSRHSKGA